MRILILNGPNLDLLGTREPEIYGERTFEQYMIELQPMFRGATINCKQSDIEGELIQALKNAEGNYDAVVLNAAGYTHTSVALRDTIAAMTTPVIEVHISNVLKREEFRHTSMIGGVCIGSISGFGLDGYRMAIDHILRREVKSR